MPAYAAAKHGVLGMVSVCFDVSVFCDRYCHVDQGSVERVEQEGDQCELVSRDSRARLLAAEPELPSASHQDTSRPRHVFLHSTPLDPLILGHWAFHVRR